MQKIKSLLRDNELAFAIWAGVATFLSYFCMYMFRKPYTAGTYENMMLWGVDYKILIVIAQVLGYATSKFLGIKIISELKKDNRILIFAALILVSWLGLVGFAYTPSSWGPFWLFVNGLPLGLIWGIVFTYCEGRKVTEVLTVFLAANFIITSGIAKSLGRYIIQLGYAETSMPMIVGLIVMPLLGLSLWMLHQIPPPSDAERILKKERLPMDYAAKKAFVRDNLIAVVGFVVLYLVLTIIRDIRDNFAVEIWTQLGFGESPSIYSSTELPVTVFVLLALGLLFLIKENKKALMTNMYISIVGILMLLITTWMFSHQMISPIWWMIISGAGLFLPYILMNGIVFDRFIAAFNIIGNVGFIMYISDATGYLGSIIIMLTKNFGKLNINWLDFYINLCYFGGVVALVTTIVLAGHLRRKGDVV